MEDAPNGNHGEEEVVYLYGFVSRGAAVPADLPGIAGRPVELMDLGAVGAAFSRLPAEEYGAGPVEARLRDLSWVADRGLEHERVVTRFVDEASILPARLLTLYSSPRALSKQVSAHEARIREQLQRLEGCHEWDLKVSYDAERLESHLPELSEGLAELEERIRAAEPGTRYLLAKKRSEMAREETARTARRVGGELLEEARELTAEVRTLDPPREAEGLPVVLNAAMLVRAGREEELRSAMDDRTEELGEVGIRVAFSGPWAPYRFVEGIEEPEGAAADVSGTARGT